MKFIFTYAAAAMIVAAGCGGPANEYDAVVTGTVTIDGELARSGIVTFHPKNGGKITIGRIHPDGSYSLRTGQGDLRQVDGGTVVPGEYVVTVSITGPPVESAQVIPGAPPIPGPSLVAAKYAMRESSDLKRTVKSGAQVINLELDAPEAPTTEDGGEADEDQQAAEAQEPGVAPTAEEPEHAQPAEAAPAAVPNSGQPAAAKSEEKPTP